MIKIYENKYELAQKRLPIVKKYFNGCDVTVEVNSYHKDHICVWEKTGNLWFMRQWCPVLVYEDYINCRDRKHMKRCIGIAEELDINILDEDRNPEVIV